jgi:hypothetical protein
VGQVASLDSIFEAHPEWQGKITGLIVNQAGSDSGLGSCGDKTNLPVVQDDADGTFWKALGGAYNSLLFVDKNGVAVERIDYFDHPEDVEAIEAAVAAVIAP